MYPRFAVCALTLCALAACAAPRGGDPLARVPADADNVLIVPSLAALQRNAAMFLAGIEGTSGALELVADRFGLDLRTPDGPARVGLDPERGLALYTLAPDPQPSAAPDTPSGGNTSPAATPPAAVVVLLPVARPDLFRQSLGTKLTRASGLAPQDPEDSTPRRFASPTLSAASGTFDTSEGAVGLLVLGPSDVDTAALWRAATAPPAAPFVGSPRDRRASPDAVRFAWRFTPPAAPANLGLLRGVVDNITERLSSWEGSLELGADALAISMSTAPPTSDTPLPVAWVNPDSSTPSRLAQVFPRTTTALLRLRVNLAKVRAIPSFVRNNMLPDQLPGLEGMPLPSTPDLVQLLDGDIGLAFLGLAPSARLGDLMSPSLTRRLPEVARVALAAGLRDAPAFERTYAAIAEQLATSGWTVAPITTAARDRKPGWRGYTFAKDARHYSLLHDGDVAVFLIGEGEADAFLAVRDGRALPLSSFAAPAPPPPGAPNAPAEPLTAPARALGLAPDPGFLGLLVSPVRLTRELAARSVPPYFLKIINDLRLFSLAAEARADGVTLHLELDL